jgi:hypothetical protein
MDAILRPLIDSQSEVAGEWMMGISWTWLPDALKAFVPEACRVNAAPCASSPRSQRRAVPTAARATKSPRLKPPRHRASR